MFNHNSHLIMLPSVTDIKSLSTELLVTKLKLYKTFRHKFQILEINHVILPHTNFFRFPQ